MISKRFFSAVNKKFKTPHWNIAFIMLLEIILGSFANPDQLAELINYGAISGFIMLNFSVIWFGRKRIANYSNVTAKTIMNALIKYFAFPSVGLIIMGSIFINMKTITIVFGTIWALIGILYYQANKNKIITAE